MKNVVTRRGLENSDMALIFKKGKEEDSERWAGQPHLSPGTTTEHVPWHLFPNVKDKKSIGTGQHVSQGRCCLGSLTPFSGRVTGSVGQGRAGGPHAGAEWGPQHRLPPYSQAGAEEIWARLGWRDRLLGAMGTGWAHRVAAQ